MSIKTKHVLAFLLASLIPLFLLFGVLWYQVTKALVSAAVSHLDSIALVQKERVRANLTRYETRARFMAGLPQIIRALRDLPRDGATKPRAPALEDFIHTLSRAVTSLREISILSPSGATVASVGGAARSTGEANDLGPDRMTFFALPDGKTGVRIVRSIHEEDRLLGRLLLIFDTDEFATLGVNAEGLAGSSETMVGWRAEDGTVKLLTERRYPSGALPAAELSLASGTEPVSALMGRDAAIAQGVIDYRGREVVTAARFIPEHSIEIVAKLDREDALFALSRLRRSAAIVLAGVAALAFVSAIATGDALTRRIIGLKRMVDEMKRGNFRERAKVDHKDEIGSLAQAFNEMAENWKTTQDSLKLQLKELERVNSELNHEVSERTRAEAELTTTAEKLQTTNEELRRINDQLDDFAYIASHDLKEPLRGLKNYSSLLLKEYTGKFDEDGQRMLESLSRLTNRAEELISNMFHYSRRGSEDIEREETDLNELTLEVLDLLRTLIEERHIEVRIPDKLPQARVAKSPVAEVFQNLISNAAKYNDKESKWIEISSLPPGSLGSDPGEGPVLCVKDNGVGISEKHMDTVYRMFRRLPTSQKFGSGAGVGLTIARKIIERHGGRIWVRSSPGEGTAFYFTLGKESETGPHANGIHNGNGFPHMPEAAE